MDSTLKLGNCHTIVGTRCEKWLSPPCHGPSSHAAHGICLQDCFFLVKVRGASTSSHVRSSALEPNVFGPTCTRHTGLMLRLLLHMNRGPHDRLEVREDHCEGCGTLAPPFCTSQTSTAQSIFPGAIPTPHSDECFMERITVKNSRLCTRRRSGGKLFVQAG